MASIYEKKGTLYLRYKDARGNWRAVASSARTKAEAKRMAAELELRAERQRLGLEPLPPEDGGGTFGELLRWWLETYVDGAPAGERTRNVVRKNFLDTKLASLTLTEVTPGVLETHLQSLSKHLSPSSLNHLRSFVMAAFTRARQAGRWDGPNPVRDVRRRKVPKRLPDFLRAEEVPLVLAAAGLINVCRSYDHDTTKGGRAAAIPIAAELRPYLDEAMAASPSNLVFPGRTAA